MLAVKSYSSVEKNCQNLGGGKWQVGIICIEVELGHISTLPKFLLFFALTLESICIHHSLIAQPRTIAVTLYRPHR
jgi:hypothetical protein